MLFTRTRLPSLESHSKRAAELYKRVLMGIARVLEKLVHSQRWKRKFVPGLAVLLFFACGFHPRLWGSEFVSGFNRTQRVVVTAVSSPYISVLLNFLESYEKLGIKDAALMVYGLDLEGAEIDFICTSFKWMMFRAFDFEKYPSHLDVQVERGVYAWKPVIIKEVSDMADQVLWLDAGSILKRATLSEWFDIIGRQGIITTRTSGTIKEWTHPATLLYLRTDDLDQPMCNGAIVGMDVRSLDVRNTVLIPWVECALIRECIAPKGSSRNNHRQDQSVLTVLMHKHLTRSCETSAFTSNTLGAALYTHQDSDAGTALKVHWRHSSCGSYIDEDHNAVYRLKGMNPCDHKTQTGSHPDYLHALFGNPNLQGGGRQDPLVVLDAQKPGFASPDVSVIISVYNAADAMALSLPTMFLDTTGIWELIIILDACYDHSFDIARKVIQDHFVSSYCVRARVLKQPTAVWETSSDNIGLRISNATASVVIVQPDMIITEKAWNMKMVAELRKNPNLFAISGRCGHSFNGTDAIGRCGDDVAEPLSPYVDMHALHFRETVNRGPLMFAADKIRHLGFFDEQRFLIENDDHDLNRRALEKNFVVAYLPIGMFAPRNLSVRRNPAFRDSTPASVIEQEQNYKNYRLSLAKQLS